MHVYKDKSDIKNYKISNEWPENKIMFFYYTVMSMKKGLKFVWRKSKSISKT